MKISPFEVYELYCSIMQHFKSENYDYFRYKGKLKHITPASFRKRRDKYMFEKLSKNYHKEELIEMLISNYTVDESLYIGDLLSEGMSANHIQWKKRMQSITQTFKDDVTFMAQRQARNFNSLFKCGGQSHPPIVKFLLGHHIGIETFIIIDEIVHFMSGLDKDISEYDFIWIELRKRVNKYRQFLNMRDPDKYRTILLENFKK